VPRRAVPLWTGTSGIRRSSRYSGSARGPGASGRVTDSGQASALASTACASVRAQRQGAAEFSLVVVGRLDEVAELLSTAIALLPHLE